MELSLYKEYLDHTIFTIKNNIKKIKFSNKNKENEIAKYQNEISKLDTLYEIKARFEAYIIAITYLNKKEFIIKDFSIYLKEMIAESYLSINKLNLILPDNEIYLKYLEYDTRLNTFTNAYEMYDLLNNKTLNSNKYQIRTLLTESINKINSGVGF